MSATEWLKHFNDLVKYFCNEYRGEQGRINGEELYAVITRTEELYSLLSEKNVKVGDMDRVILAIIDLNDIGIGSNGLQKLVTFVRSAIEKKFDLEAFTGKYNLDVVLDRMVSYDRNRQESTDTEKRIAELRVQERQQIEKNCKTGQNC